jgi:predicted amidohydrolase YtcJ
VDQHAAHLLIFMNSSSTSAPPTSTGPVAQGESASPAGFRGHLHTAASSPVRCAKTQKNLRVPHSFGVLCRKGGLLRSRGTNSCSFLFPIFLFLFFIFVSGSVSAQQSVRFTPAEIIIVHAKIYTVDEKKPWADSLAILKGKIVAIGKEEEVTRRRGIGTKMIDAGGKLVLPGFTDCHIHFLEGGLSLRRVKLEGAHNVAEIQDILKKYAEQHPDDPWILGRGWDYTMFAPETLPDKKFLDPLFPVYAVFLESYDGHTFWANSKALALAGITKSTPDPLDGKILRDPQTGEATGVLLESAGNLVKKVLPKLSEVDRLNALRAGMKLAIQNGITRVHSAGGDFGELEILQQLRVNKQLWVRFHIAYNAEPPELRPEDLAALETAHKNFHDEWIDVSSVKFFLDGVIETHTAALLEPYSTDPSTKGQLFWDPEKYRAAIVALDKKDFQIYSHAVGDAAVRAALDAYDAAAHQNHSKNRRHRIEHIETIAASDIPRFGKLGVIASMQPLHSYPDDDTLNIWARAIGPDRSSRAWMWKSIALGGGEYAFGSDWPIVTMNPWEAIQTAVTRQTVDRKPEGGFIPSQKLTVAHAIEGYTRNAAFAGRLEKYEGSLEVGKAADLIMLDRNIFEIEPHTIHNTQVVLTIVGGNIVYEAPH